MHVVVVGSGIAGLITALEASRQHDVTIVTKSQLAESNTKYAQGGIAAALFPDDSVASHVADTLVAGAGLSDPAIVRILCAEGPVRVRQLIELGVAFDRASDGTLQRGHEAAHSHKRVIHAGGDATGLAIELALVTAVRASSVRVLENHALVDLLVSSGTVTGVNLQTVAGMVHVAADIVVLASGGAGQLYSHTTNPAVTTGDGVAAAWRAGAVLSDVEFYQFHPTSLAVPGNPLVSEAVRGEGAVLRSLSGERFMLEIHPAGELAPRDVVARGIAAQMARQGGAPVLLDATALGADFLRSRFPGITVSLAQHGLSWDEPLPVTPAAHYWMGGVRTDADGRTSLPGLFAVGEVSCTGVHGANRLASNSLLESLVFAWRAAAALSTPADAPVFALASETQESAAPAPLRGGVSGAGASPTPEFPTHRADLQRLMWDHAGLYREAGGLARAAAALERANFEGTSVHDLETRNLRDLGRVVVQAALAREESRGAHYRTDFPDTAPAFAHHSTLVRSKESALV